MIIFLIDAEIFSIYKDIACLKFTRICRDYVELPVCSPGA